VSYWHWILSFAVAGYVSLFTHELSHALVAWVHPRGTVVAFRPFPHFHNGRFYFGRCTTAWTDTIPPLLRIAPLYKDGAFLLPCVVTGVLWWQPMLCLAVWSVIDALWWVAGIWREGSDAWRYFGE
jgi:hypothetical protein